MAFTRFSNPDVTFVIDNSHPDYLKLEIGEEYFDITSLLTDTEIMAFVSSGLILPPLTADFSEPDINDWRSSYRAMEERFPRPQTYPAGRAYQYFSGLRLPEEIKVWLLTQEEPGSSLVGVAAENDNALFRFQEYMYSLSYKINFRLK